MPLPEHSFEAVLTLVGVSQRSFYRLAEATGLQQPRARRYTQEEVDIVIAHRNLINQRQMQTAQNTKNRNRGVR